MKTAAQKGGGATKHRITAEHCFSTTSAAAGQQPIPDLPVFRDRLVAARARLVERIILEYDPAHQYPGTAWVRMVSDLHTTIMAVDAMIEEST